MGDDKGIAPNGGGPLAGTVVVDATNFLGGPFGGMLLADLGADVIKLEAPPGGDPSRQRHDNTSYSSAFAGINRTKRSLLIDLKKPESRPVLEALIRRSDIFLTSLRPKSRGSIGLDYPTLSAINPRLIYCSITGYGERGPAIDVPAFDTVAQARSGLLSLLLGDFDQEVRISAFLSDISAGIYACCGVLAALQARHRTGVGQEVRTSLLQATMGMETFNFFTMFAAKAAGQSFASIRPAGYFLRGSDGVRFAAHVPPSPPALWKNFIDALDMVWLDDDARFCTTGVRAENYSKLHQIIAEHVAKMPGKHWMDRMAAHNVACAPILKLDQVFDDPIVRGLGMLHTVTDPWGEQVETVGSGIELLGTPIVPPRRAPLIGEHNNEILQWLGFTADSIDTMTKGGVLGPLPKEAR